MKCRDRNECRDRSECKDRSEIESEVQVVPKKQWSDYSIGNSIVMDIMKWSWREYLMLILIDYNGSSNGRAAIRVRYLYWLHPRIIVIDWIVI